METLINNNIMIVFLVIAILSLWTIILLFLLSKAKKELSKSATLIEEKEEKIHYLRQIHAELEYKKTTDDHTHDKQIITLNHTVSQLEIKLNEGTKNQVVSKIEAFQNKRSRQLQRVGLAE